MTATRRAEIRLFDRRGRSGPAASLSVDGKGLSNTATGFTLAFTPPPP